MALTDTAIRNARPKDKPLQAVIASLIAAGFGA